MKGNRNEFVFVCGDDDLIIPTFLFYRLYEGERNDVVVRKEVEELICKNGLKWFKDNHFY